MSLSDEQLYNLREELEAGSTIMVEFEKANGDLREMICVLNPEVSGDTYEFKGGAAAGVADDFDSQLVWEPILKQWRKFKYSAVKRWAVTQE